MITPQGTAKILDFGLAKAAVSGDPNDHTEQMLTGANEIYGTAAYMSPEQAAGAEVDFRTDQYSFGRILVEMLTGRRDTSAPDVPPPLAWIIERCLEKDPQRRYASTSDLVRDLEAVDGRRASLSPAVGTKDAAASKALQFVLIAALLVAAGLLWWRWRGAELETAPVYAALDVPEVPVIPLMEVSPSLSISPDGKRVAIAGFDSESESGLWVRDLGSKNAVAISGGGAGRARHPAWSPDGRQVAFLAGMAVDTSQRTTILQKAGVQDPLAVSQDGASLLFQETRLDLSNLSLDLSVLSLDGRGARNIATSPFEDRDGRLSPSGQWIAYSSNASGRSEIYVVRFDGRGPPQIVSKDGGSLPRWASDGRELVYLARATDLMSVTVTEAARQIEMSEPRLLLRSTYDIADYDVTADGQRIVIRTRDEETRAPIQLIFNAPRP